MRQLTELHSLELEYCNSIASLPYWFGELTSLKKLSIKGCDLIRSLPEGIQQLTNLQDLYIGHCPALQKWCETEEEIMKPTSNQKRACALPTSLKKLTIDACDGISSLPEGIQQLTNLQELLISACPALQKWCETEEEIMKPTPNQKRACVLPTSLKKLEIDDCDGIISLPEGIQQLTNLQKLSIGRCPALKKWCDLEENATKLAHIKGKVCVHTLCHVNDTIL
jgi:Leucine-rich repeat (LRR) protein